MDTIVAHDFDAGGLARHIVNTETGVTRLSSPSFDGHVVPIAVFKGSTPGPCICVTAGIHGSEYCALGAAQRIMALDPNQMSGTLVVLPLVNGPAFERRSVYLNPIDGKNLNRVFPGKADGSASERLAHWLTTEVFTTADYLIDLHCGDLSESLAPFTIFCDGDGASEELARHFGLPDVIANPAAGMTIFGARGVGIPAIIAEAGGAGIYDEEAVDVLVNGLHRAFRKLGLLQLGEPNQDGDEGRLGVLRCHNVVAEASGFWRPAYPVGESVEEGARLGDIHDVYGDFLTSLKAPIAGKIMFQVSSLSVSRDDTISWIGVRA